MNKKFIKIFISLFIIVFFAWLVKWIHGQFGRINFDEIAIVLNSGIGGTDSQILWAFVRKVLLRSLFYAGLGAFICHWFKYRRNVLLLVFGCYTAFMIIQIAIRNVQFGSFFNFTKSNFYETEYADPQSVNIQWPQKRNVLIIALESIEKVYGDQEKFGEVLTPYITELEQKNISFENYHSIPGLSHTIAAITGFVSGLPLFYTSYRNTDKMTGAYGIGKILNRAGYQTWSIFPASGNFSKKESFMYHMGFDHVIDGEKIYAQLKNPPKQKPFHGVDDGVLFEWSKPVLSDIIKSKQPYFIFMETINTHLEGFFTDYCRNMGFKQETTQDITKCDDKIIYDFVKWFRAADPTAVIILLNDHKQHSGPLMKKLNTISNRPLANVFINTPIFQGADLHRPVSAMDFFPTMLSAAGAKIDGCKMALGVSLDTACQGTKTLRERFSDQELQSMMEQKNDLYYQLATGKDKK